IKATQATLEGLSGVFRHLVREHGEVSTLLLRLKFSADPNMRRELWSEVRAELLSHERAEITEVYPALRQDKQTLAMVQEHDTDASDLEELIDELSATDVTSDRWQPTLERLIAAVQEHVRDEEEEYFPIADYAFKERSDDMLERYERAKAKAKKQIASAP
ncbi:MAG TPA: hemerythrin domain-containing protein, partial [Polyangiales bacterium]|nr:hemerythrin domain-containing protein [Polyangiales bacterium]